MTKCRNVKDRQRSSTGNMRSMTVPRHLLFLIVVLLAVEREISSLSTTIEFDYTAVMSSEDPLRNRSSDTPVDVTSTSDVTSPINNTNPPVTPTNEDVFSTGLAPSSASIYNYTSPGSTSGSNTSASTQDVFTVSLSSHKSTSPAALTNSSLPGVDSTTMTSQASTRALAPTETSSSSSSTSVTSSRNVTFVFVGTSSATAAVTTTTAAAATTTTTATTAAAASWSDSLMPGLAIGLGVGGGVLLIAIIICITICAVKCCKKSTPRRGKMTGNSDANDVEKRSSSSKKKKMKNADPEDTRRVCVDNIRLSRVEVDKAAQDKYRKIRRSKKSRVENQLTLAYTDSGENALSSKSQSNRKSKKNSEPKLGPSPSGLNNGGTPGATRSAPMQSLPPPLPVSAVSGVDPNDIPDDEPFPPPPAIGFINSSLHQFVEATLQPIRMHPSAAWKLSGGESITDPN